VTDHDGRLPDPVVGVERHREEFLDAGARECRIVGRLAAGQQRRVHDVSGGFEEARPGRQERRAAEHTVQEQDRRLGLRIGFQIGFQI
jgi:hypothetical protein